MVIYANELETKEHKNKFWTPVGRVRREKKKKKVSLSVFSLVPDLWFDCSRVLEFTQKYGLFCGLVQIVRKTQRKVTLHLLNP